MIDNITLIGEWILREEPGRKFWQEPLASDKVENLIIVSLRDGKPVLELTDLSVYLNRLLYRSDTTPTKPPITPVFYLNLPKKEAERVKKLRKLVKGVLLKWLKQAKSDINDGEALSILQRWIRAISENEDEFLQNLADMTHERDRYYLALMENDRFLFELKPIDNYIFNKIRSRIFEQFSGKPCTGRARCFICGREAEVTGNAKGLGIYTLDKLGFIAGGMNVRDSWKNLPVCWDCVKKLEAGKIFVKHELNLSLGMRGANLNFYLIPNFYICSEFDQLPEDYREIVEDTLYVLREFKSDVNGIVTLNSRQIGNVAQIELMAKFFRAQIGLNYLFYQTQQARTVALAFIQDVLPSWLYTLLEWLEKVERRRLFKWLRDKTKLHFSLNSLAMICSAGESWSDKNKEGQREFFSFLDDLTHRRAIKERLLFSRAVKYIRKALSEVYKSSSARESKRGGKSASLHDFYYAIYRAGLVSLTLLSYNANLNENSVHKGVGGDMMVLGLERELALKPEMSIRERVAEFFKAYSDLFTKPERKAVFLTGVLTQMLAQTQRNLLNSEKAPILNRLKNLRMTPVDVMRLYKDIIWKYKQYSDSGRISEPHLLSVAGEYFLLAGDPQTWDLSSDELNFFVALGIALKDMEFDGIRVFSGLGETDEANKISV